LWVGGGEAVYGPEDYAVLSGSFGEYEVAIPGNTDWESDDGNA
jgi:hypothetical protein